MKISILGAGAFGTALAISIAKNRPVSLWGRDAGQLAKMQADRENRSRLPGAALPSQLEIQSDLAQACTADILLISVPMQSLSAFLGDHPDVRNAPNLVACCKGIEIATGRGPVDIIQDAAPQSTAAILTGPSFASDIAKGLPTALTLGCADDVRGRVLQQALATTNLRLYRTTDTKGAELGGALKNVVAIACGAVMGAQLGQSARAAVMTRGFAEITRLAMYLGAEPATLAGLSGFGDLALTCTSDQSRNYKAGLALGQGKTIDPTMTVEGAATAQAVLKLSMDRGIDMPLTEIVAALVRGDIGIDAAIQTLLARPLKEE